MIVLFWFTFIYQECMYKTHLLLWIIFADFSSALVTQSPYLLFLYSGNFFCSAKKKRCYFSHGLPCTLYFQGIVCPKPCFLVLICHYPNSMSKTDFCKMSFIHKQSFILYRKNKVFWIMLIGFNLALLNLTQSSLFETYLQIKAASRIEVAI